MTPEMRRLIEPPGTSSLPGSLHGINGMFPEIVYILYDVNTNRRIFMDARYPNVNHPEPITDRFEGLACFGTFQAAKETANRLADGVVFEPIPIPFELARTIAKAETEGPAALILADAEDFPLVHFVS